jgi:TonB-dependent receptor
MATSTTTLWAQYGRIAGQVVEAETNQALPGANIVLLGTTWGAAADSKGRFHLSRVPAGTYTLQVRILGYQSDTATVQVQDDRITTRNFSLRSQALPFQEMVVWGMRAKGQAQALNRQLNASNIINIVATDQMGKFPDATAPDAIQRLPGVAVTRDQGEARYLQIRGGAPQMTAVLFNGESVPSPEGDVRQIALDAVPVDVLESIEVSKAILPDMEADAIGGMVNLITKRAPDALLFTVEGASGYAQIREEVGGNGAVTFGRRIANGKFGFLLNGSYYRRDFGSDDLEPVYNLNGAGLADDALNELQVRHYTLRRNRLGGTLNLDYRPNSNSTLYLNGIYSELQDDERRLRLRHRVSNRRLEFVHKTRLEELTTMNFTAGGDHLFSKGLRLDYHLTFARSGENTPRDDEIFFRQGSVTFSPNISDPDNIQANPAPGTIGGTYRFNSIEPATSITENTDYVGALNLTVPFNFGRRSSGSLKFGGKYRHKFKDQDVVENAYALASGAANIILGQGIGQPFSNEGYNPGNYPFPPFVTTDDEVTGFLNRYRASLNGGAVIEQDVNDYEVTENTIAAYAMTELNFTPTFALLPGIRFERTNVDANGFAFDPDTEVLSPSKNEKSYNKFFPMLHARYRLTERTNLRAAITRALVRPNFYDLVPYRIRDGEDFSLGNTALDPTTSWNFDVIFEHYDRLIGVMSVGAFYKRLSDPIFIFTTRNNLGGGTSQPQNGESGTIRGIEVALQQQLKFLPGFLNGLGVYGNYTFTDSDAKLPSGDEGRFPGQAQHVVNTALSYEKGGFSGQISLNFIDDFVDEFGGNVGDRAEDVFIDNRTQLDFSVSYRFSALMSVFAEVNNLTNQPFRLYQGTPARPLQAEYYERWGRMGLRLNL